MQSPGEIGRQAPNLPVALIVSPFFPPATLAGVHRARHLAKHLPAAGWRPIILCVDERHHEQTTEPGLADLLPGDLDIHKVGAISQRLCRPLGLGDISLRAWQPLRRAMRSLITISSPKVVLITGAPYYQMLMARELRTRWNIPVVLDFQDPWVSTWGATRTTCSKEGMSYRLACQLEPKAVAHAAFITSVSETQNEEMRRRYSWLDRRHMAAIPIGGDPDDFEHLRRINATTPPDALSPSHINLSFVGTFMPRSGPLVRLLLQALAELRSISPAIGEKIRFNFIGTSNHPDARSAYQILPIAHEMGVADAVFELPRRVPYLQALAVLARSDATLLIGSDEPHYTASKIYPALMCGRPYLALFHPDSSSYRILKEAGGGRTHAYLSNTDTTTLVRALADDLHRLAADPTQFGTANPEAYAPYEARAIAKQFAEIFDKVTSR